MLSYKVQKKYAKGPEQLVAKFDNLKAAQKFINESLESDASMRVNCTYILYDMGEPMETHDQTTYAVTRNAASSSSSDNDSSSGGKGSGQHARPTPLQTTLRPAGMPLSTFKNENKDEQKQK
jgi:hypothetical protein